MDDRRRDGGTNSTLRTKEQGTHLTLNEHDDDDDFSKHTHTSKLMKILPVGAELCHADRLTDRYVERSNRCRNIESMDPRQITPENTDK